MFNKKLVNFSITVESPTIQEPKESNKIVDIFDEKTFAFPTNLVEIFIGVGNLKKFNAFGIDGVLAEILKISLLVNVFLLIECLFPFLWRGVFWNVGKLQKFIFHKIRVT